MDEFIMKTPAGDLQIHISEQKIILIEFLKHQLQAKATKDKNSRQVFQDCKKQMDEYFMGTRVSFDLPLQITGTDFQMRVWKELQNIPYGKTISYLELAKRLGDPKCIRAAASANGKNPFSIVIPCHRVIGTNGTLVGYGGGIDKKRWLLGHENHFANGLQFLF